MKVIETEPPSVASDTRFAELLHCMRTDGNVFLTVTSKTKSSERATPGLQTCPRRGFWKNRFHITPAW